MNRITTDTWVNQLNKVPKSILSTYEAAYLRLSQYENTGLCPSEIEDLINEAKATCVTNCSTDELKFFVSHGDSSAMLIAELNGEVISFDSDVTVVLREIQSYLDQLSNELRGAEISE